MRDHDNDHDNDYENGISEDTPLLFSTAPPTRTSPSQPPPPPPRGFPPITNSGGGATLPGENDDNLVIFRRAIGINSDVLASSPSTPAPDVETGRRTAVGMYRSVLEQQRRRKRIHHAVSALVWSCHGVQIVVGAALTSLGLASNSSSNSSNSSSNNHKVAITVLGAVQTIVAGVLTTLRSKGLPEKLSKPEAEFRELQVWIEETEALVAVGVAGRSRDEVGALVETAFGKYNACFGRSIALEGEMDRALVSNNSNNNNNNGNGNGNGKRGGGR